MLRANPMLKWGRGLLMASVIALGVAAFAAPARAGSLINLDPTGGGGANANNVLSVSSFAYLPGNTLSQNGGNPAVGDTLHTVSQAILGSINTVGANSAALGSNNGNISTTLGGNTGMQFVIETQFNATVAAVMATPGGGQLAVFNFAPGGINAVNIYAQSATAANSANVNDGLGAGFTGSTPVGRTLILSGVLSGGFTAAFVSSALPPITLDQHAGGNTPSSLGNIPTLIGTGNASATVAVTFQNNSYFLPSSLPLSTLNVNTVSSATPFRAVEPETVMFTGATNSFANLGPVNGLGTDFLFQTQANNDFQVVPEPHSIATLMTGMGFVFLTSLRVARRRRG
jgi:hypothetical protein